MNINDLPVEHRDAIAAALARYVEPPGHHDLLGTGDTPDEPSATFDQRIGRCYELAAHAVTLGAAPAGSTLVHGSIHGARAPRRIGHAWVRFPDGSVWEPITATVYPDGAAWSTYAGAVEVVTYAKKWAVEHVVASGHWGPWDARATDGLPTA